ncbi:MAG: phosphatase PAP2 family protein, partial [Gemmatimonadaceae bacterium]
PLLALLIMLGVAWLTEPIVNGVLHNDSVAQLDLTLLHWFRSQATDTSDALFVFISLLGAPVTMIAVSIVGAALIYRQHAWRLLVVWIAATSGSSALTQVIKHRFNRPRPGGAEIFLHGTSVSFPSGHAVGSIVVLGMIIFILNTRHKVRNGYLLGVNVGLPMLIAAIGLSRLCLGVHYGTDVVAGFLIGGVWLFVCIVTLRVSEREV